MAPNNRCGKRPEGGVEEKRRKLGGVYLLSAYWMLRVTYRRLLDAESYIQALPHLN